MTGRTVCLCWVALALGGAVAGENGAEPGKPKVINAGRGGHNSRNLLARLDRDVLAHRPDLVVLMVGTNDVLNHGNAVPLKEYRANLGKLIKRVRAAKSRVLLATILPCHAPFLLSRHPAEFYGSDGPAGRIRKANAVVRAVAKATRVVVVDLHALFEARGHVGAERQSWLRNPANSRARDGVHPTAEGYQAMAEAIASAIAKHRLPHRRIVCLGDSITYGAGMKGAGTAEGETYPAVLARLLGGDRGSQKGAR